MVKKQHKKNCIQVNKPEVDNSSPCSEFNYSQCVILNRTSNVVKLPEYSNLDEYLQLLENEFLKMQKTITSLKRKVEALQECKGCNQDSGIGTFNP